MYLNAKLAQPGAPMWAGQVPEGATLGDVVEAAGATVGGRALSQDGRRASADDPLKPGAMVMLSPKAEHG